MNKPLTMMSLKWPKMAKNGQKWPKIGHGLGTKVRPFLEMAYRARSNGPFSFLIGGHFWAKNWPWPGDKSKTIFENGIPSRSNGPFVFLIGGKI